MACGQPHARSIRRLERSTGKIVNETFYNYLREQTFPTVLSYTLLCSVVLKQCS